MKKSGYIRAIVHVYKDDEGKLQAEFLEKDITQYGHLATKKDSYHGWLQEEIDNGGDDWLVELFEKLPNDDHVYEVVGDLYYECYQNQTWEHTEWETAWELRDESIKPVYEGFLKEWEDEQEEHAAELKSKKRDPMVLYDACKFYAEAFDKKLSGGGMGQFTPFLVDRGARAKNAMSQYDWGMTLAEMGVKDELPEEP